MSGRDLVQPRRSGKGSFSVALAALFLLLGLGLPVVALDLSARMLSLAKEGVVDGALVTGKREERWRETNYRGLPTRPRIRRLLSLEFDRRAQTRHSDFMAGQPLLPSANPEPVPVEIPVSGDVYARYAEGDRIMVTFRSDVAGYDKDSFHPTETVVALGAPAFHLRLYLAALALLASGMWLGVRGWRQSRETAE